jgi:hypothetical protein
MGISYSAPISKRFILIEDKYINIQHIKFAEVDKGLDTNGNFLNPVSIKVYLTEKEEPLYYSGENAQNLINFLTNESEAIIKE